MEAKKTNKKTAVIGIAAAVIVIALLAVVYTLLKPKAGEGSKTITITVVGKDGKETKYDVKTDAQSLRKAFADADGLTVEGAESEYGLMVDTVNGVRADFTKDGAYWSFMVNGEYCNYGVDEQPVNDGDAFEIVYTPA